MGEQIRVLAVADPAVMAYVDPNNGILEGFSEEVIFDVVPWDEYYPTMMDVFAGKASYDVVMVAGHLWLYDFVKAGYLRELHYEREDIMPVIYEEMKQEGKLYLSPSFCDGHIITYRKSVLADICGNTFEESITVDELIRAVEKVYATTGKPAIALKAASSEIFTDALPYLRMNGADVYDGKPEALEPGLVEYCKLKRWAVEGTETFGNAEIAEAIQKGHVPIATTWSGQMGVVYDVECEEPEDLGFTTFDTAWNVTWSFAISSSSLNADKAERLLEYLRSPNVDRIVGNACGAPIRKCNYDKGKDGHPWYPCQLKMFENAKPLPKQEKAGDKNGVFYEEIWNAFTGKTTPGQAIASSMRRINKI